jgi:hypothetical protein
MIDLNYWTTPKGHEIMILFGRNMSALASIGKKAQLFQRFLDQMDTIIAGRPR